MDCKGVRAKSEHCGEGIQVRGIRLLERAPLLDILMKSEDSACDPRGKTAGEEIFELKRLLRPRKMT